MSIFKIDLNAAEIKNIQDYVCTKKFKRMYGVYMYTTHIMYTTYILLKLRVNQVTYESKYNDNTKSPKPKENHLRILEISSRELMRSVGNSAEGLGYVREHCVSIFENTTKSCRISPLKVAATLLSGSGKGAVGA